MARYESSSDDSGEIRDLIDNRVEIPAFHRFELGLPTTQELAEELAEDPANPTDDSPKRNTARFTPDQQRQIAIWVTMGYTPREASEAAKAAWGKPLAYRAFVYYKLNRPDLADWAREFVKAMYLKTGMASRDIRVVRLSELAEHLRELIEQGRAFTTESYQIKVGTRTQTVTKTLFDATLIKEYRETLALLEKTTAPMVEIVKGTPQNMPSELRTRFIEAEGYNVKPSAIMPDSPFPQ